MILVPSKTQAVVFQTCLTGKPNTLRDIWTVRSDLTLVAVVLRIDHVLQAPAPSVSDGYSYWDSSSTFWLMADTSAGTFTMTNAARGTNLPLVCHSRGGAVLTPLCIARQRRNTRRV